MRAAAADGSAEGADRGEEAAWHAGEGAMKERREAKRLRDARKGRRAASRRAPKAAALPLGSELVATCPLLCELTHAQKGFCRTERSAFRRAASRGERRSWSRSHGAVGRVGD